ncbi:MAG: InlB B-repeat-containing protein, partial [Actinomycetia bacterium]|nr:InlB B-repeat-containing protein [Actinomycetes bacterium]
SLTTDATVLANAAILPLQNGGVYVATTYTAHFAVNQYTIKYNANGATGSMANQNVSYGENVTLTNNAFTQTGYHFTGWNTATDGTGAAYTDAQTFNYLTAGDTTLYAQWAINTYTVQFVDPDGNVLKTQTGVPYGTAATAPTPPDRPGYHFVGWNRSFNYITGDLIVTALYAINYYTVIFVDAVGNRLSVQTVAYGDGAIAPAAPARTGYRFIGWDVAFDRITSDLTVTALYVLIPVPPQPPVTPPQPPVPPVTPTEPTPTPDVTPIPDTQSPLSNAPVQTAPIIDNRTPLASGAWALLNLILSIVGALLALVTLAVFALRRKKKDDEEDSASQRQAGRPGQLQSYPPVGPAAGQANATYYAADDQAQQQNQQRSRGHKLGVIAAILLAIVAFIVFFLTENWRLPWVWVDRWTILHIIIFVLVIVAMIWGLKRKKAEQEEDDQEVAAYQGEATAYQE